MGDKKTVNFLTIKGQPVELVCKGQTIKSIERGDNNNIVINFTDNTQEYMYGSDCDIMSIEMPSYDVIDNKQKNAKSKF